MGRVMLLSVSLGARNELDISFVYCGPKINAASKP